MNFQIPNLRFSIVNKQAAKIDLYKSTNLLYRAMKFNINILKFSAEELESKAIGYGTLEDVTQPPQ